MAKPNRHAAPDAYTASAGRAEGAEYARKLLERIGAGTADPDDLASVMQFLHSGAMLQGFAAVIFVALRRALTGRSAQ